MKMIRCDGCDRVEDYALNNRAMPEGFSEVSVSISAGPVETNNGTHVRYDLCSACQTKLREAVRVNHWPRAASGSFLGMDTGSLRGVIRTKPQGNSA
jgi:hypothetical protein